MVLIRRIEKKTWPEAFQKILDGDKTFEIRLADFEYRLADILVLKEYDPKKKQYTGRVIEKKVSYVKKINDMPFWPKKEVDKYGLVVISLK